MDAATLEGRLEFIRQAERLKDVLRSGRSSGGRQESTAEHSWRLCLMAMLFQDGPAGWIRCACCSCAWSTTWARRWAAMCRRSCATRIRQERASAATCCNWPAAWTRRRASGCWRCGRVRGRRDAGSPRGEGAGQDGNHSAAQPGRQSARFRLRFQPDLWLPRLRAARRGACARCGPWSTRPRRAGWRSRAPIHHPLESIRL